MNEQKTNLKEASNGWIITGFVFAFLGGIIGVGFGVNYAFGNYDKSTKNKGWVMIVLGVAIGVIWRTVIYK